MPWAGVQGRFDYIIRRLITTYKRLRSQCHLLDHVLQARPADAVGWGAGEVGPVAGGNLERLQAHRALPGGPKLLGGGRRHCGR